MADETQAERPMAEKHPFTNEDGEEFIAYSFRGGSVTLDWRDEDGKFVEVPFDFRPSALADELLRVVAERDEARARIVALETENAELRKELGRAERAIQREGEQAFDAGLSEGWSLHKEVSGGR